MKGSSSSNFFSKDLFLIKGYYPQDPMKPMKGFSSVRNLLMIKGCSSPKDPEELMKGDFLV